MKTMTFNQMEQIEGGGNFFKCALHVGAGMIGGAEAGFAIGTAFLPGYGTALGTAFGLYLGGVGAGLSSSACMN
jgi:bacteriocin-like protein